jgi:hypothetical protein
VSARAAVLAAALLAAACSGPNPYAGVASIERTESYQQAALLAQAWRLPVAAAYAIDGYEYQANPSVCGPTSIANLLQSKGGTETQADVLRDARLFNIMGLLPGGITLDQAGAILSREVGRPAVVIRDLDPVEFRAHLLAMNDPGKRYIVNFHRGPLFGRGHGHFSPILGYLPERDLVFVGDVNDDYRPWLAPSARVFEALDTVDSATGKKRGLLLVSLPPEDVS